jgi:hypothetical protein
MGRVFGSALTAGLVILVVLVGPHIAGAQPPSSITVTLTPVTLTAGSRDLWFYLTQVATPVGTLVAIVGLIFTMRWNAHNLRTTYFTKEWSTLMQFLQPKAKFMDPDRTRDYGRSFTGAEKVEYELVARLCIGYVDDLYFLGGRRKVRNWFRGSVKLLVGTHRTWLDDHQDAYDARFYRFVIRELERT